MQAAEDGQRDEENFRQRLRALLATRADLSCAGLSRALGRNHAYLQQYLTRRSPRRLPLEDKLALARIAGVAPAELGLPSAGLSPGACVCQPADMPIFTPRRPEALRAWVDGLARHPGSPPGPSRQTSRRAGSPAPASAPATLGEWLSAAFPESVFGFLCADNALAPAIRAGDLLFVDAGQRQPHDDGIYLCDLEAGGIALRRLFRRWPHRILLVADNAPPAAAQEIPLASLTVLGRVIALHRPLAGNWPCFVGQGVAADATGSPPPRAAPSRRRPGE
ncbi:MAG: S24 family peptidase [Alphaproteobacteria bacterium]|nr:MAG: S24 family peptidase [Alphaproteobacteria bacterium]